MMKRALFLVALALLSFACCPGPANGVSASGEVPMYPDYTDITIPSNIAPLNFLLRDKPSGICVYADGVKIGRGREQVMFRTGKWRKLLARNEGRTMDIAILAKYRGEWKEFRHFGWTVSTDRVDAFLTYRLIEPDYETFNNIVLQQRCVENFKTENFSDCRVIGNKCMNCHTYAAQNPDTSMFYVRGEGGGALLNIGGKLQKLAVKGEGMVSGSVYFGFSPTGKYIAFSSNVIIPGYHATPGNRMEVYDTQSDVYVADLDNHKFIRSSLISNPCALETFPCFSPDGKHIYYCTAKTPAEMNYGSISQLKYSLCRVDFDELSGTIGTQVDTVYNASVQGRSVCHPRISPDGRFLCLSLADYGTFPLWHKDSDLAMIDLKSGELISMEIANSDQSDTYHSWSGNSRWVVFASKRDDGIYGKPYYTHIDADGRCSKAFVLPQRSPRFYDNILKSYNVPEMGTGPLPFDSYDVKEALRKEAVKFE